MLADAWLWHSVHIVRAPPPERLTSSRSPAASRNPGAGAGPGRKL